jgi:transposase InsO family protein
MSQDPTQRLRVRWARLRFSVVGPLLTGFSERGELTAEFERLSQKSYRHPTTGEAVRFSVSTLERWYYQAKKHPDDPFSALARKVPSHAGTHRAVSVALGQAIFAQHREHPRWSYQLHYDNLVALAEQRKELLPLPSYPTVVRFMKAHGLCRQKRRKGARGKAGEQESFVPREVRSFEVEYVHGLWHLDFHEGSKKIVTTGGAWVTPILLGVLDDRSRLCGHLQWYLSETAETLCHGLMQAILKRGLPRALLTDNGAAMLAAETREGLERLGIVHHTTLPYSPEQNAKQECFWAQVEGRLIAMLEGERELDLSRLNQVTQAWVELDYHHRVHSELGKTPLEVFVSAPNVGRQAPDMQSLRRAFRTEQNRTQRISDGTITVEAVRFEIPSRYRTLLRPTIRFARWDLSTVDLVDPRTGTFLCALYPLDKRQNADRRRRILQEARVVELSSGTFQSGRAPLLEKLMKEYAATGLPPAYLPPTIPNSNEQEEES